MKIAIYDPDSANRRPWNAYIGDEHDVIELRQLDLGDQGDVAIIFVHGSYLADTDTDFRAFRTTSPNVFFVVISAGPPHAWWKNDGCSYWRRSVVSKPGHDFAFYCQRFLRRLAEGGVVEFGLLEPSGDNELAFRLLCEASRECKGLCPVMNFKETGISIHAPVALHDWLDPFGPPDADDSEKIAAVARMMGGKESEAKALLTVVEKNPGNAVSIQQMIGRFLGDLPSASANS